MPEPDETGLNARKLNTLKDACMLALGNSISALRDHRIPADRFLASFFRCNHKFGSRDRRAITSFVFAYYRWYGCLRKAFRFQNDYHFDGRIAGAALAADRCDSPLLPILLPDFSPVDSESPFRTIARIAGCDDEPTSRDLVPDWAVAEVSEEVLDHWILSLQTRPHAWIRVQHTSPDAFRAVLSKYGVETEPHPVRANALMLKLYNQRLDALPKQYRHCYEVQDLSSQCIVAPADPRPGEAWWDFCAGGGGKTLELAAMAGDSIRITATDIRQDALEDLISRARMDNFRNIRTADFETAEKRRYDGIITDVPCSSSGRWRRTPDIRFLMTPDWLEEINRTQYGILCRAADALKPGGRIVYGTCSVFRRENRGMIGKFLADHPDFEPVPFPHPLDPSVTTDGTCLIDPSPYDADFAFCALLRRKQ